MALYRKSMATPSMCAKSLQSCLSLCDPVDCSPPSSSVYGIPQAWILEWVAMPSSRGSSWPRDRTHISHIYLYLQVGFLPLCFPRGSKGKESACNAGDWGSIPGSGRCPEEGNSIPLQYSCLGNPMDRGAWWATVHGIAKSWTWLKQFSMHLEV